MTQSAKPRISLADAIAELPAGISRAKRGGEGQDVRFAAKEIEVELFLDFCRTVEATAGFAAVQTGEI